MGHAIQYTLHIVWMISAKPKSFRNNDHISLQVGNSCLFFILYLKMNYCFLVGQLTANATSIFGGNYTYN
jgi:hypothetical protein